MGVFNRGRPKKEKEADAPPKEPQELAAEHGPIIIAPEFFDFQEGDNPHNKIAIYAGFIAREMLRLNAMLEALINLATTQAAAQPPPPPAAPAGPTPEELEKERKRREAFERMEKARQELEAL